MNFFKRFFTSNSSPKLNLSLEEALDICGDYGSVYADLNDAGLVFKPESRLPASRDVIKAALKISVASQPQMLDDLRESHNHCYVQLALFVPDLEAERAQRFCNIPYVEIASDRELRTLSPIQIGKVYFAAPQAMGADWAVKGLEYFGKEFYNSEFFGARDSAEAKFVRMLATRSWADMQILISEWEEFLDANEL